MTVVKSGYVQVVALITVFEAVSVGGVADVELKPSPRPISGFTRLKGAAEKTPIPGAVATLAGPGVGEPGSPAMPTSVSGEDGCFTLGDLTPGGTYEVGAVQAALV